MILLDNQDPNDPQNQPVNPVPGGDDTGAAVVTDEEEGNQPEVPGETPVTDVPETGEEPEAGQPVGGPMGENPEDDSQGQDNGQQPA